MPRYINEDDFCEYIRKNTTPSGAEWFISKIKDMPAADVIEVKHGEWKHNKNNDVIKCSVCGFGIMDGTFVWKKFYNCCGTIEDNPLNFCPNCGADMDTRGDKDA